MSSFACAFTLLFPGSVTPPKPPPVRLVVFLLDRLPEEVGVTVNDACPTVELVRVSIYYNTTTPGLAFTSYGQSAESKSFVLAILGWPSYPSLSTAWWVWLS